MADTIRGYRSSRHVPLLPSWIMDHRLSNGMSDLSALSPSSPSFFAATTGAVADVSGGRWRREPHQGSDAAVSLFGARPRQRQESRQGAHVTRIAEIWNLECMNSCCLLTSPLVLLHFRMLGISIRQRSVRYDYRNAPALHCSGSPY